MPYPFPPDVQRLVQDAMTSGDYASEDDLLRDALSTLRQQREDLAAIQAGIDDMEAGRVQPFEDVVKEIRSRHGLGSDA